MQPPTRQSRKQFPWFLNPRLLGMAILIGIVLLLGLVGLGLITREAPAQTLITTPIMNVILAPTATLAVQTPTPGGLLESGNDNLENSAGAGIVLNAYVQITGTGGDGLRFRDTAGLDGKVKFVASEAEIFVVKDGPSDVDGYTWWYLVGPFDQSRNGWAVSSYLTLTQNP